MPRGQASKAGDRTVNRNGYDHTKTDDRGWVGTHVLIMEEHLGRRLGASERVRFKTQDIGNLHLDNLEVYVVGTSSLRRQEAALEERIREMTAQLAQIRKLIAEEAKRE